MRLVYDTKYWDKRKARLGKDLSLSSAGPDPSTLTWRNRQRYGCTSNEKILIKAFNFQDSQTQFFLGWSKLIVCLNLLLPRSPHQQSLWFNNGFYDFGSRSLCNQSRGDSLFLCTSLFMQFFVRMCHLHTPFSWPTKLAAWGSVVQGNAPASSPDRLVT